MQANYRPKSVSPSLQGQAAYEGNPLDMVAWLLRAPARRASEGAVSVNFTAWLGAPPNFPKGPPPLFSTEKPGREGRFMAGVAHILFTEWTVAPAYFFFVAYILCGWLVALLALSFRPYYRNLVLASWSMAPARTFLLFLFYTLTWPRTIMTEHRRIK